MQELSQRQIEIAKLIAEGMTYDEIGDALGISPSTAKAHTNAIRLKLGVKHKRHIPKVLRQLGIIP